MCPVCGGALGGIGSRKRKVIDSDGAKRTLVIRRLRCKICGCVHHELPDMVIPYKRHCAQTIETIIGGSAAEVICDESTIGKIKRWWAACRLYFERILVSLGEKFEIVFPEHPVLREIARAVANTNLWPHTRSAWESG